MSNRQTINTDSAPRAVGAYSQAVKSGTTVYISGQIPLIPETMELLQGNFKEQTRRCFENLQAIAVASGGALDDAAKITVFLTDIANCDQIDEVMADFFKRPYPARVVLGVKELQQNVPVEIEAILELK